MSGTGPLQSLKRINQRTVPSWDGTWFSGSAIDASQAKKFWPPVDDILPPSDVPPRPVLLNDPDLTVTTVYSKPTDHLPADHGSAISPPGDDSPSDAWYSHMATLVSAQKWFFAGLGFASIFLVAALVYFWRKRMSPKTASGVHVFGCQRYPHGPCWPNSCT